MPKTVGKSQIQAGTGKKAHLVKADFIGQSSQEQNAGRPIKHLRGAGNVAKNSPQVILIFL